MEIFLEVLKTVFTFNHILLMLFGVLGGVTIGALPGLTVTMAVSLLVSVTYGMETFSAILVLGSVFVGGVYGGSNAAVLLNIPGTPAAGATAIEGHAMANKGQAGRALGLSAIASFCGGIFGTAILMLAGPLLAGFALDFGSWEFFLLAIWGVSISASLAGDNFLKGMISGFIGLFVASIGMDAIYAYPRFSFGVTSLSAGINLVPAMIGLFGVGEVLYTLKNEHQKQIPSKVGSLIPPLKPLMKHAKTVIKSTLIGSGMGALPGAGADIAAWVSYGVAKNSSKNKEEYGTGSEEGLMAAETANNAQIGGAFIPTLILAVPGGAVTAVILGALRLHGVRPGPMFYAEQPTFIYAIGLTLFVANFIMLFYGLTLAPHLAKLLQLPRTSLLSVVTVLTVVGAYAVDVRYSDILVMFIFGLGGFLMREMNYSPAPMVLGIILGPMADENFRRALLVTNGSLRPFFTRPICVVLIIVISALIIKQSKVIEKVRSIF